MFLKKSRLRWALAVGFILATPSLQSAPPPPWNSPLFWAGGLTLATMFADRSIHNRVSVNDNNTINTILGRGRYGRQGTVMEMLGQPYVALGISGVFYGAGLWGEDDRARRVGAAGAEAILLAGGTTLAIKWAVGRNRPYKGNDPDEFRPFSGDTTSKTSFPSGHAAVAFALASAIADEYNDWRVDSLSYGTATAVAVSRVYQDRHWASDVVAGGILGIGFGKWARRRAAHRQGRVSISSDGRRLFVICKI